MKKLIGICFALCLFATAGIAQTTASSNDTAKKNCEPTKECAAKMGMTLAECKKVCTGKAATGETKVASALLDIEQAATITDPKKSKECAKKCTKSKAANTTSDTKTQVAAAVVNKDAAQTTTKKECTKMGKKTCAKKAE